VDITQEQIIAAATRQPPTDKDRYAQAYSFLFNRIPANPRILELGMGRNAASVRMWRELLGPAATIYGAEIVPEFAAAGEGICDHVFCGDLSNKSFRQSIVQHIFEQHGHSPMHLIIDDGSHFAQHIHECFNQFFAMLQPGGIYVIEDLETNDNGKYHKNYRPRPLAWLSPLVQQICTGPVRSKTHEMYFHRNLAAVIKQ